MTTIESLQMLAYAGLSDVFCVLTAPANLSEGQKYRFRLACCLATGKKFIFADEFCSNLDRITAAVIAYNVRRFAKRNGVTFFLASSHEDILADLQPDVLIVKNFTGPAEVSYKKIPNHK
jgi:ABC-type ATPase with predicted acetyltransferase domain